MQKTKFQQLASNLFRCQMVGMVGGSTGLGVGGSGVVVDVCIVGIPVLLVSNVLSSL